MLCIYNGAFKMTWETTANGKTWTHRQEGFQSLDEKKTQRKGKVATRSLEVKKGVYVIDHRPTGLFIVGSSDDVSREVDNQLAVLQSGQHKCKRLQRQYAGEPILLVTELEASSEKAIRKVIKEIKDTNTTDYCLLAEVKHNEYFPSSKTKPIKSVGRK